MTSERTGRPTPTRATAGRGVLFGADYNPEQWPPGTVAEDVVLMQEAGVTVVTLGVFSWALLEPEQGCFETDWLEGVMDQLHAGGIAVDLATATASPPPWFTHRHPESMLQTREGTRLWQGGRQDWCPSSPVFRERSLALVEVLADRLGEHPALVMWHVSNELGCHNASCYCDVSAAAFRGWLERRYGDLDALNTAWATDFWSQRYGAWDEIVPPRAVPAFSNPTQELDFRRFSSDALLEQHVAEREVLRARTPTVPVTTNFMVMSGFDQLDYAQWAPQVDVVSNDHYTMGDDPDRHVELAFCADATRGLAGGDPWVLMEHSTSAVNWQPRNRAKVPGEMRRNSLQHLARGADGICFFQWRASRGGAEKFHSALVPHAGTGTKVWREVVALGADLAKLREVVDSRVRAEVAMVVDYPSRWAAAHACGPSVDAVPQDTALSLYGALWRAGTTVDVLPPTSDLTGYRLVVVPSLYLMDDATAGRLEDYVAAGGCLVVTYFSGIVDEHDHVRLGGYPGALRELLGISTEEFFPLQAGESVGLDDGSRGSRWTELVHLHGARAVLTHADPGHLRGTPAVTRHTWGEGEAWYVATHLDDAALDVLLGGRLRDRSLPTQVDPPGVERVVREGEGVDYTFLINHREHDARVDCTGTDLLTGESSPGSLVLPAGGVRVMRTSLT